MTQLELAIHDSVITTLSKIKNLNDTGIELIIPENSVLLESILNLKLIKKDAEKHGFSIQFSTDDIKGQNLIEMLDETGGGTTYDKELMSASEISQPANTRASTLINTPKNNFNLPKLPTFPKFQVNLGLVGILGALLSAIAAFFIAGSNIPKATAELVITAQPLIRSLTIKVLPNTPSDAEKKLLKGTTVSVDVTNEMELPTTGEKLTGKKATGTVTIVNTTKEDVSIKKGTVITYKKDKDSWTYTLDNSVTVPKAITTPDPDPLKAPTITLGKADENVTATDFGESFNIADKKTLTIKSLASDEIYAVSKDKFSGGTTTKVKIVADADLKALSQKLLELNATQSASAMQTKVGSLQKLITGSVSSKITSELYNYKVGDQKDTLKLSQTVTATGLVYTTNELNFLVDKLVDNLIPQGFVLGKKTREINVEILGNSAASVVSSSEADIQVTVKTFIVPDISVNDLKKQLAGKNLTEAQKVLGSIESIKTYKVNVAPSIPFFQKIPKDTSKITVNIETI